MSFHREKLSIYVLDISGFVVVLSFGDSEGVIRSWDLQLSEENLYLNDVITFNSRLFLPTTEVLRTDIT